MLLRNRANQNLTENWPLLGAQMPGGLRVQVVVPPAVEAGKISLTTRRPIVEVLSMDQIIQAGAFEDARCEQSLSMSPEERARIEGTLSEREHTMLDMFRRRDWRAFFKAAVEGRKNIVSSGATGSGKTTLGNALAAMIPQNERIITVEDVPEMRLAHPNQVNLFYPKGENGVSKLKARDLLEACLRMRPDRVLLAELRGDETFYFIQNVLNSGHPGTITTVHASRAKLAFRRLALLIKGSSEGAGLDLADITDNLYALVDIIVQMERLPDGRRIATEVYFDPAFAARQLG
jgi:type IV secretion system protein VirB11